MLEVFPEGKEGFSHFRITGDSSGLPLIYSFHPGWVEGSQPTHTLLFFPITNRGTQKWVPCVHAQLAPAHLVICVHLLLTPFSDRKKLTVSWDIWVRVRVFTEMCSTIGWDDSLPIQMHLYEPFHASLCSGSSRLNTHSIFLCPLTFLSGPPECPLFQPLISCLGVCPVVPQECTALLLHLPQSQHFASEAFMFSPELLAYACCLQIGVFLPRLDDICHWTTWEWRTCFLFIAL